MIVRKKLSAYNIGDEVEICFCDTGGKFVWSHPAVVTYDEVFQQIVIIGTENRADRVYTNKTIDGYYTYLDKRFKK
jgi:hypothetical protein